MYTAKCCNLLMYACVKTKLIQLLNAKGVCNMHDICLCVVDYSVFGRMPTTLSNRIGGFSSFKYDERNAAS